MHVTGRWVVSSSFSPGLFNTWSVKIHDLDTGKIIKRWNGWHLRRSTSYENWQTTLDHAEEMADGWEIWTRPIHG